MEPQTRITYQGAAYPTYIGQAGTILRVRNDGYLVLLDNGAQFVATAADLRTPDAPPPTPPAPPQPDPAPEAAAEPTDATPETPEPPAE